MTLDLVTAVMSGAVARYVAGASLTILLHDHIITIKEEVSRQSL